MTSPAAPHLDLGDELTRGFASRFIAWKARQLVARRLIQPTEREDTEQELRLILVKRLPKFDPNVASWTAFVRAVVDRHAATMVRQQRKPCRRPIRSLDRDGALDDGSDEEPLRHCESHTARAELRLDIETVVSCLPGATSKICRRLMHHSVAQLARDLAVPRSTLRDRIVQIRSAFVEGGFEQKREPCPPS